MGDELEWDDYDVVHMIGQFIYLCGQRSLFRVDGGFGVYFLGWQGDKRGMVYDSCPLYSGGMAEWRVKYMGCYVTGEASVPISGSL